MSDEYEELKATLPLAVPAIKATIDNWLVPAIHRLTRSREFKRKVEQDHITESFSEYLLRTYARLSFMNTIVFGNQQKRIQDLYIPLTVRSTHPDGTSFVVNNWLEAFVPAFKRIVLTDTAGMGKSTILKWLFICSLGNSKSIPIFVELRTLSSSISIIDKICKDLSSIDKEFDREYFLHLVKDGNFTFFLDGFDEVAFEDRKLVTEDVQSFISKGFSNNFLLASRHETALASFGDFKEFGIQPLAKNEAYTLLRKYDDSQEHAEALIVELEESKYEQLKDLMINPMLVSLLFKAYSYKPKVPFKKQIFYRQVFDALFDMHDSTKGGAFVRKKHSSLDIDEFHLVMRDLGFTTAKLGKVEYEKDIILDLIKKVRERNGTILFQPAALLDDLLTTVPLFNKEGDHFKWAHKSVQDYFASQYIALDAKGNEIALLEKIYNGGHCRRFENILDMLHDTDNKSFRQALLASVLRDFIKHYDNSYLGVYDGVPSESIELRKQLTFGYSIALATVKHQNLNKLLDGTFKKVEKMFSNIFPKAYQPEMMFFFSQPNGGMLHAVSPNPGIGLLPLLANKKYSYVSKAAWKEPEASKMPLNKAFLITDDPSSPMNSPQCFENVNQILCHHGFYIDINDARRTLSSIEEEACNSLLVDQLFHNL